MGLYEVVRVEAKEGDSNNTWGLQWRTIIDALCYRAAVSPSKLAFLFLDDDGREKRRITWGELDQQARSLAVHLRHRRIGQERVLLLYPPTLDYILAFFGCLYAGAIPVPAYPPRQNKHNTRLQAIINDAAISVTLCSSSVTARSRKMLSGVGQHAPLTWIETDTLEDDLSSQWVPPQITEAAVALYL